MMTVTSRVIVAVCWMVLALLGIDYPNRYWGIGITALVVIGVVLLVQLRRTQCEQMSSELPLKADIAQYGRHVSKVPISNIAHRRPSLRRFEIQATTRKISLLSALIKPSCGIMETRSWD